MLSCNIIAMESNIHHLGLILLFGIAIFGGTVGARIFKYINIPQVIGYLFIGLIIGESGFRLATVETVETLRPFNYFALGIIGFMIGGELKSDLFKKYGKQFTAILLAEGLAAFIFVGIASTWIVWLFTKDIKLSVALGAVLGAISSATDPASTIQVLWEYKTRGPLTTAATAVVALDDALALTLYGIGTSVAGILTGSGGESVIASLAHAFYELGFAVAVGVAGGAVLTWILHRTDDSDSVLAFVLGSVMLVIGLAIALKLDIILAAMSLGLTLVNMLPRKSENTFEMIKKFAPPI